ncbi:uncharacterized protein LOC142871966 [Microcebus murinus]|uniref:uncharacterized protein LOC142871966 n=1 Tax=Microcebus murinus TaxID=30608 RepID=UPI003F6B5504
MELCARGTRARPPWPPPPPSARLPAPGARSSFRSSPSGSQAPAAGDLGAPRWGRSGAGTLRRRRRRRRRRAGSSSQVRRPRARPAIGGTPAGSRGMARLSRGCAGGPGGEVAGGCGDCNRGPDLGLRSAAPPRGAWRGRRMGAEGAERAEGRAEEKELLTGPAGGPGGRSCVWRGLCNPAKDPGNGRASRSREPTFGYLRALAPVHTPEASGWFPPLTPHHSPSGELT